VTEKRFAWPSFRGANFVLCLFNPLYQFSCKQFALIFKANTSCSVLILCQILLTVAWPMKHSSANDVDRIIIAHWPFLLYKCILPETVATLSFTNLVGQIEVTL